MSVRSLVLYSTLLQIYHLLIYVLDLIVVEDPFEFRSPYITRLTYRSSLRWIKGFFVI